MKFAYLLLIVTVMIGNIAHAQEVKIASVDVRKIFNEWKYSIKSQGKIESAKEVLEAENNDRLTVINQHQMERTKLHQKYNANKATMSDEDKKKMDDRFRSLGRDASALEQDRRDFFSKGKRALEHNVASEAKLILTQISQAVQVFALEKKYDMVVETGGHTTRNVPLFMHLEGAVDITEEILKRLNDAESN